MTIVPRKLGGIARATSTAVVPVSMTTVCPTSSRLTAALANSIFALCRMTDRSENDGSSARLSNTLAAPP